MDTGGTKCTTTQLCGIKHLPQLLCFTTTEKLTDRWTNRTGQSGLLCKPIRTDMIKIHKRKKKHYSQNTHWNTYIKVDKCKTKLCYKIIKIRQNKYINGWNAAWESIYNEAMMLKNMKSCPV